MKMMTILLVRIEADHRKTFFVCIEVLRPVNPVRSCRARSVYPTTLFLGRLSAGERSVEGLFDLTILLSGLLLVPHHRAHVLLAAIRVVLPKLYLERQLKFNPVQSLDLFLELGLNLRSHTL